MKVYLVGGAVRDQLLDYPVAERDWVVTGATPELMIEKGYRQVGSDFPVFLHPKTGEEYALARKERKQGSGYYGFECDTRKTVTLEEDLLRRDLTINAMAMDDHGNLVDPYHGFQDLKDKKLRHVSEAFVEDPVRVLRVARFAARYHHLGFTVADETVNLMYDMMKRGELLHLVAERVWQEMLGALKEKNPEAFFQTLRAAGALQSILPEIDRLFGVPNPRKYHPEVDSGIHTLLVLQEAVAISPDPMIRFAAMVHDLGKAVTPRDLWPSHHGHEELGVEIIDSFCRRLRTPVAWRKFAMMVSRYHLMIHRVTELRSNTILRVLEKTDAFRRPELFLQMLEVCRADAGGRQQKTEYRQGEKWREVLHACAKISATALIREGKQGIAIKQALHQQRCACIDNIQMSWRKHEKQ